MTRRFGTRLAPLTLCILIAACGGANDSSLSPAAGPAGPSPVPSPTPSPSPSSCNATITGLPSSVSTGTGRYPFTITIASNCAWTARTEVSWADVAPGSGSGNATPTLNVNENTAFFTRTLTVIVNGQSFQATQASVTCSNTLDRTSLDESSGGGSASVKLTTMDGCGWTATASESWIRVVTPSGTGSATIYFELAPNTGDVRHAFVTIAGQRVDVTQRRR
jgi:hypothetical protein